MLPRSLQLLGSAYAIATSATRFYFYKEKYLKLQSFWTDLPEVQPAELVAVDKIALSAKDRNLNKMPDIRDFAFPERSTLPKKGRYVLSGQNGSSKSTLLRAIKARTPNAIFIGPDICFQEREQNNLSTGQRMKLNLETALASGATVLLLDEWNAHLDTENREAYERALNAAAENVLVIEVKHYSL